jgi:hypothetical protein
MILFKLVIFTLLLTACGTRQIQESEQTVTAHEAVVKSSQDAIQAKGANVQGNAESVYTENVTGISPYWFIVGALAFGIILPRPKFIKLLF